MGEWQRTVENMVIDCTFWQGKTVLITGHTGFKGGWFSLWLQYLGAKVIGYALPAPTNPSLFEIARVGEAMTSIQGDVRDFEHIKSVVTEHRPQIIVHMAAQSLVRHSYENPVETYATNVMGTVNLLEAVRTAGNGNVKAVINITSDKCYENREWVWGYRENEPMGGHDPYSNSKGCSELVTAAYRNSFFNPVDFQRHGVAVASARAGNVIGGGDWAKDRLMPDILRAIQSGVPARIRNPNALRPWQHVLEPLSGYLLLAQKLWNEGPAYSESWNFGPNEDDAKPVSWIADNLAQTWGNGASWVQDDGERPHEAHYLRLDCTKAKTRLGWQPVWCIDKALRAIVDWHQAFQPNQNMQDMQEVTLNQIKHYVTQKSLQ